MAGLQRFVSYIFKYENDEKLENAGFAKIRIRGNTCSMEIHISNVSTEQPEATVYLFARNGENIQGISIGTIKITRGNGDIQRAFQVNELSDFGITMGDLEGIFIPVEDNMFLASQWKEGSIRQGGFRVMEKKDSNPPVPEQNPERPDQTGTEETENQNEPKEKQAENESKAQAEPEQPIQATEIPLEEFFAEKEWERLFQKFRLKSEVFFPFEGEEAECIRMQLNDLRELPKKYWYLGKNSFLLHGFFNYRHIILGEMGDDAKKEYFIGVPGVFQNQERIMASMFGFPEFRTAKNTKYKTGNFGYWYRIL